MHKKIFLLVTCVAAVSLIVCASSQAAPIEVHVGASLFNLVWQTSPPAFAPLAAWVEVGLATVINGVNLSASMALLDLQAMAINSPPSLILQASTEVARWSDMPVEAEGRAIITPDPLWIGLQMGAKLRAVLYQSIIAGTEIFLEATRGAPGHPAGWALGIQLDVTWSWHLFEVSVQ